MSIEDFRGLFSGEAVTKEMFEECQLVNSIYADIASRIVQREEEIKLQLKNAQAQWEGKQEDPRLGADSRTKEPRNDSGNGAITSFSAGTW